MFYRPHERVQSVPVGESKTKQSEAASCNINTIMAKYAKNGIITHVNRFEGKYGDFSETMDYQSSINAVMRANEMFMSLPAKVRAEFENDPGKFVAFATDSANLDKLREMGLARPAPEVPDPVQVQVVGAPELPLGSAKSPPSGGGA